MRERKPHPNHPGHRALCLACRAVFKNTQAPEHVWEPGDETDDAVRLLAMNEFPVRDSRGRIPQHYRYSRNDRAAWTALRYVAETSLCTTIVTYDLSSSQDFWRTGNRWFVTQSYPSWEAEGRGRTFQLAVVRCLLRVDPDVTAWLNTGDREVE